MGIAPLAAWRHSTAKTIGKAIWKPFAASLVVLALVIASGVRLWAALLGFWLAAFVACVTLYEYGRAVWKNKAAGESLFISFWRLARRNRRRYGGYIIHLSVVLMSLGIIGVQLFQTETQGTLNQNSSLTLSGYTVTLKSLAVFDTSDGRNVARAVMTVAKGGKLLAELYPRVDYYYESQQQVTIPAVRSTPEDDLYLVLVDWQSISSGSATFKIYHNPLVMWLWVGGLVFILGTLVAAWPDRERDDLVK
jgi:cytochrome c-type biogenesis protein CcmF